MSPKYLCLKIRHVTFFVCAFRICPQGLMNTNIKGGIKLTQHGCGLQLLVAVWGVTVHLDYMHSYNSKQLSLTIHEFI